MKQIQIPLGMRDIILEDCAKKTALQKRIEGVFESYGYQRIMTPSIEFFQTYQNAFSEVNEQDMYKFFDQDGQILTLRMDMTVPIARVCASKYTKIKPPYRIRYCSNVFKVRQMFAGQLGEISDCGVELIGLDSSHDLEVLVLALDTMEAIGVDDYQLEIGNSDFFKLACQTLQLDADVQYELADLVDRKSMVELKEFVKKLHLEDKEAHFFMELPLLSGSPDALDKALELSFNSALKAVVLQLKSLYEKLSELGYGSHIQFDLGKVPHLDYYTGIIFEGYVNGVGHSVLSGGRYDSLLKKFGRDLPACGFSVKLDYLLSVVKAPKTKTIKICYPESKQVEALKKAQEVRKTNPVELVIWDREEVEVVE